MNNKEALIDHDSNLNYVASDIPSKLSQQRIRKK